MTTIVPPSNSTFPLLSEESAGVEPARDSRHRLQFSKLACCRSSNSPQLEEPERVERSKPISRTCPLSRREGLPCAQQLHFEHGGGERESRTPVALIALASAFQAGTLPLGHLSMEEPGRVERPWPISRTNPLSRRVDLPRAQQLQMQATRDSDPAKPVLETSSRPARCPFVDLA